MKNFILPLLYFHFFCGFINNCDANAPINTSSGKENTDFITENTPLITENTDLPLKFKTTGSAFTYNYSIKFKKKDGDIFATANKEKLESKNNGLVLRDNKGTLITTSTLYKLPSSGDKIYLIKDQINNPIGYLSMYNTSLKSLFKPIKTVLYSSEGDILATTVFTWSAFGTNPMMCSYKTYSGTDKQGKPIVVCSHYPWRTYRSTSIQLHPPFNIDTRLILSMMVIHTEKKTPLKNNGTISIDELNNFSSDLVSKTISEHIVEENAQEQQAWLLLKETLEETCTIISLNDEEIESIIAELSLKFEHDNNQVFIEEISQNIETFSNEEKNVLLHLINLKIDQ